ncbi:MAG: MBL fold metallo-hydrolase, partial [Sphingomonas sp.]
TLAQQRVEPTTLSPFTARQLVPGIHVLGTPPDYFGPVIGNITVIEQRSGVVLIDSGGAVADGRRVVAFVRSITDKPVTAVVVTHWHADHPAGVSAIRQAWPRSRVISTATTRANLLGAGAQYLRTRPDSAMEVAVLNQFSAAIAQLQAAQRAPGLDDATRQRIAGVIASYRARMSDIAGTHLVPPSETFTDRLLLDDPVNPVELRFLGRANTDGDAIAWLPRQRIVVTGDVVVAPIPFGFFSYPADWIAVLERIKALQFAILVPGHGQPQTDTAYLDQLIGTLTDVRTQVAALAGQGLSLEQVREQADFSTQTAIFGATPRAAAAFRNFWLTPIVESAFREARGEPITQGTD